LASCSPICSMGPSALIWDRSCRLVPTPVTHTALSASFVSLVRWTEVPSSWKRMLSLPVNLGNDNETVSQLM
jgi:hypothetical protein